MSENNPLIYCEGCGEWAPILIEPMKKDTVFPHQGIWGDIVCSKCRLVNLSIRVPEEGAYEFKKVREL